MKVCLHPWERLYYSSKCYCLSLRKEEMYLSSHTSNVNFEIPALSRLMGRKRRNDELSRN